MEKQRNEKDIDMQKASSKRADVNLTSNYIKYKWK